MESQVAPAKQLSTNKKKVLIVSHSSVVSVYQKKIQEMAKCQEIDFTLFIPSAYFESGRVVEGNANGEGYRIERLRTLFGRSGRQNLHFYPFLFSKLREVSPNIIHLEEEPESLVTFQCIFLSKFLKLSPKVVLFTWRNIDKTHREWGVFRPQKYLYPQLENYSLRNLDYLIAGNKEGAAIFAEKGYSWPIEVIPQYGVDAKEFHRFDSGRLRNDLGLHGFVIGYVGRLWKPKGIDTLLKSVVGINAQVNLLLIGSGPHKSEYVKVSKSLGISNRVKFVESIKASDVPKYMNCLDVLVLPSRTTPEWKEQFGRVLIEAMACEVPVVGSSSGEIPNVIGNAGLTFREGDQNDLAEKLEALIADPELRARLIKAGRQRVAENFTNTILATKLLNVYSQL